MKIGIFYATYSGGTHLASLSLTEALKTAGHQVDLKTIDKVSFEDTLNYDLRIFASPSWEDGELEGQPHEDFKAFIEKSAGKNFNGKSIMIFGLGDTSYGIFCGAVDYLEEFVNKSGGKLVAQSLRIDNYMFDPDGFNKKLAEWAKTFTS